MIKEKDAMVLDSIESAIEDIKNGKVVIVVDDEDRENEGDFITAAANVTPEVINFMSKHGRGLICAALTEDRCAQLELDMMVRNNTDPRNTAFTVSVDLLGHGCTTGISAHDRSKTVQALIDPSIQPSDLARPGHIFPLKAKKGGVLRRTGHTEATIDLARLAGLAPAGVLVEIMNDDGTMARLPELVVIAQQFNIKLITIKDLIAYRLKTELLVEKIQESKLHTAFGDFNLHVFRDSIENKEFLALVKGKWRPEESVPVRVHRGNILSDLFAAPIEGQSHQLHNAMRLIDQQQRGVIVYMNPLQRHQSIVDDIRSLGQESDVKKPMDARDYGIGAQILRSLGVHKMILLSNHPVKRTGILAYGLEIVDCLPLEG
jgi:3,4-dihydroxy 2-butanone 4-phosphate synthase / GTP cyclohydrolase II